MTTILIAIGTMVAYVVAYKTYGRWLGSKIFELSTKRVVPSVACRDDVDFCPTKKHILFGHHFTSIAGTGPIVGPAIAMFWGWVPALLWIIFGSIFIGAVHDFGSLVVSIRHKGKTIGEVAGDLISPRARLLFLFVLFFCLVVVLGIFGLVIAVVFSLYPESVYSVWIQIPLAVGIGFWAYKKKKGILVPSLIALAIMYAAIWWGTQSPLSLAGMNFQKGTLWSPVMFWTGILFVYCFIASVLPVWTLLQPRDFINGFQLKVALGLLFIGMLIAGFLGKANMSAAPAFNMPDEAQMLFPFLFVTVACGAVSGFHCLVSSGTSSKQISSEADAPMIGYGSMLLEGLLAVTVIIACSAGLGMGRFERKLENGVITYSETSVGGAALTGREAWNASYGGKAKAFGLKHKLEAFINGSGNFLAQLGIPLKMAIGIMAVFVACFAATTLDTATRLQRYVIQEISGSLKVPLFTNKYAATGLAVATGLGIASINGGAGPGSGGLILWPVFGATNQLLACFAFLVIAVYLWRRKKPVWFIVAPMIFMLVVPSYAMFLNIRTWWGKWQATHDWTQLLLIGIGLTVQLLLVWLLVEAWLVRDKEIDMSSEDEEPGDTLTEPA